MNDDIYEYACHDLGEIMMLYIKIEKYADGS